MKLKNANDTIGIKNVLFIISPDNRFDSVDLLDIIKVVSKSKRRSKTRYYIYSL